MILQQTQLRLLIQLDANRAGAVILQARQITAHHQSNIVQLNDGETAVRNMVIVQVWGFAAATLYDCGSERRAGRDLS